MNLELSCFLLLFSMTFGDILHEYDEPGKKIARQLESTQKKITNAQLAVVFNKECIKNNLLPNFTNIHLNEAVQQRRFTFEFRKKLVVNEIEEKTKLIDKLQDKLTETQLSFDKLNVASDLKRRTVNALYEP